MSFALQTGIVAVSIILAILCVCRALPVRIAKVYAFNFALCLLGWEIWMTYGVIGGQSEQDRLGVTTNPVLNMSIMSAGDALVGVAQVEATLKAFGPHAFKKWNWKAFALIFGIGIVQNLAITFILRKRLEAGKLSLAPMMPIRAPGLVMNQEGWIIQPFIFYAVLIRFHKEILDISDEPYRGTGI